jgi:photosystem II stability/assembly factor-like uncharacterized protein
VDWPRQDLMVVAAPDGTLHQSSDSGRTWTSQEEAHGAPQAIDIADRTWLLATQHEILRSTDEGRTWQELVNFGP